MQKQFRSVVAAAAVIASAFMIAPRAHSVWIGTAPATGLIQEITANTLHDLYYVSFKLSVPIPNCTGSPTWFVVPNKTPAGGGVIAHAEMVRMLSAAKLANRNVHVWAETLNYGWLGQTLTVCVVQQITMQ